LGNEISMKHLKTFESIFDVSSKRPPYGGIYNELAKSMTSLYSANTLGGIYNELAKSIKSLCSANIWRNL
jgi:hypothetical protein